MGERKYVLSREDIGLLMAAAGRPEAMNEAWIGRFQEGVTEAELYELFHVARLSPALAKDTIRLASEGATARESSFFRTRTGAWVFIGLIIAGTVSVVTDLNSRDISLSVIAIVLMFVAATIALVRVLSRRARES